MTQLGDFQVKEPSGPPDGEGPRGRTIGVVIAVTLAAFALGLYWFLGRDAEEAPVETVTEAPAPVAASPPVPAALEPEPDPEPIEAPTLNDSDSFVRDLVSIVSSHPGVAAWFATDGLIGRFVVTVDNIAEGNNPSQHISVMEPETQFETSGGGEGLRIDARSYSRYDRHAEIVDSLDTRGTADVYRMLEPQMNEAYVELGYPDTPFVQTLERAIVRLLETPVVQGQPTLIERGPLYHYADETLESLAPVQKQFMGMGPDNVRTVQAKLRQIAIAVGIPDSRLP